jgi:hypothetical protein
VPGDTCCFTVNRRHIFRHLRFNREAKGGETKRALALSSGPLPSWKRISSALL